MIKHMELDGQLHGRSTKLCDNTSVGVLITDHTGDRVLMFERATRPFGVAPIAGHVNEHGTPEDAAIAEAHEELGLTITELRPVYVEWYANRCRRLAGPLGHGHNWTVYRAEATGTITPAAREARSPRWVHLSEVVGLAQRTVQYARGEINETDWQAAPGLEPIWTVLLSSAGLSGEIWLTLTNEDRAAVLALAESDPYR